MPDLNGGIVLAFMKKALCDFTSLQDHRRFDLLSKTLEKMSAAGLIHIPDPNDTLNRMFNKAPSIPYQPLAIWLVEAYQQLLTHGYIVVMANLPGSPADSFVVTQIGAQWAADVDLIPEDQKGYLRTLKELVPGLDGVVFEYIREALTTYHHRLFFSSSVMLGAASEKVIYLLMEALLQAVSNPQEKQAIQNVIEKRGLPSMFKRLLEGIAQAKKAGMPYSIHEEADHHLICLQDAIRVQRNEAVHPQARHVSPAVARLSLSVFPYSCKKAYDLITWFKNNKL